MLLKPSDNLEPIKHYLAIPCLFEHALQTERNASNLLCTCCDVDWQLLSAHANLVRTRVKRNDCKPFWL